jgi:hypothetical protein
MGHRTPSEGMFRVVDTRGRAFFIVAKVRGKCQYSQVLLRLLLLTAGDQDSSLRVWKSTVNDCPPEIIRANWHRNYHF